MVVTVGNVFSQEVVLTETDRDWTGWTVKAEVQDGASNYVLTLTPTLTAEAGGVGRFTLAMTPAQTAALVPGRHTYDLEIRNPSGEPTTIAAGVITVRARITRADS